MLLSYKPSFLWQPELLLRNENLVITHGCKFLSNAALDLFPYNLLPFSLLSTIQFYRFFDFSKLLRPMSAQGLCTGHALLETFVQPHSMVSLAPHPLRVTTPFLQTAAHISLHEEAPIATPLQGQLAPLLPCSLSLLFSLIIGRTVCNFICVWLFENCLPLPLPT